MADASFTYCSLTHFLFKNEWILKSSSIPRYYGFLALGKYNSSALIYDLAEKYTPYFPVLLSL